MHERALRWPGNNSSGLMSLFWDHKGGGLVVQQLVQ